MVASVLDDDITSVERSTNELIVNKHSLPKLGETISCNWKTTRLYRADKSLNNSLEKSYRIILLETEIWENFCHSSSYVVL